MNLGNFAEDHRSLVLWAAHCAELGLPRFEEEYPEDDRPRRTIEAGLAWARGEISTGARQGEARAAAFAAHAAGEREWQYRRLPKHLRPVASPDRGGE